MSLLDRFEPLDPLSQGEVHSIRARERATGRVVEVQLFSSEPDMLSRLDDLGRQASAVLDRGNHEGAFYIVTPPVAALDSAGAWRIPPQPQKPAPATQPAPGTQPGDFTRMFQLRQAPDPAGVPAVSPPPAKPAQPAAAEPGEFTRAFQRPAAAAPQAPASVSVPGQPGEFTRMFQPPARPAPSQAEPPPAASEMPRQIVPEPAAPASQQKGAFLVMIAVAIICAIAVFVWMRGLY